MLVAKRFHSQQSQSRVDLQPVLTVYAIFLSGLGLLVWTGLDPRSFLALSVQAVHSPPPPIRCARYALCASIRCARCAPPPFAVRAVRLRRTNFVITSHHTLTFNKSTIVNFFPSARARPLFRKSIRLSPVECSIPPFSLF